MKIIIIMPAYNEAMTIAKLVKQLKKVGFPVIVVNDCSADNTAELAKKAGAELINLPIHLGAWGAIQAGMGQALNMGADIAISIDADGQHYPKDIPKLLNNLNNNDIVIGSCVQRGSFVRKFAWKVFRMLTGLQIHDLTSGFRLYTAKAMIALTSEESLLVDYQDVGVLLLARKQKLKMSEIEVNMQARLSGKSHVFCTWFKVIYYVLYTIFISCVRR